VLLLLAFGIAIAFGMPALVLLGVGAFAYAKGGDEIARTAVVISAIAFALCTLSVAYAVYLLNEDRATYVMPVYIVAGVISCGALGVLLAALARSGGRVGRGLAILLTLAAVVTAGTLNILVGLMT
jgi:hypothetical protein